MSKPNQSSMPCFGAQDIQIEEKKTLFSGFFQLVNYRFRHRLFQGGWSKPLERELLERGHAVAVLPYDVERDQVVLVEQIRVGALMDAQPWQFEIVAGMIEEGELAEEVALRELEEEAGLTAQKIKKMGHFYPSSGGCSERLTLYIAQIDAHLAQGIHGLATEGEDIRVHVVDLSEALSWIENGKIENAASIISLQWLALHRVSLRNEWNVND